MPRGVHGEKIVAALENEKLPETDKPKLSEALTKYDNWIKQLNETTASSLDEMIEKLVNLLNEYKLYIDVEVIFDSHNDFLYREKGQLKIDNTIMEEFLPVFIKKCLSTQNYDINNLNISSQIPTFSSMYFESSLGIMGNGGGMHIKQKAQDFSMSRPLYVKTSYSPSFDDSVTETTNLGYILAEVKTNLDKTMFQEGSATAHDVKQAVTGAKYFLLCDFLDMTPISTTTTDIDEILITRKAKRPSSNIRKSYNTYNGRQSKRTQYVQFLTDHPYSKDVLKRFFNHIISQLANETLVEDSVLNLGYF